MFLSQILLNRLRGNRPLMIGGALALLIAVFFIWNYFDNRNAIQNDRNSANAKAIIADRDAMIEADRRAAELAIITAGQQGETKGDLDDAIKKNPEATQRSSGPATNAVADSLRQRAHRDN